MDFIKIIGDIFSGGTVTVVLKLILGIIAFFVYRWIDKKLKEAAHKKTMQDRAKEQADLDQENRDIFNDAKKSEDDIEDLIKKRNE